MEGGEYVRISERQLCYLMLILRDSLPVEDRFSIPQGERRDLYTEILRQQSTDLVDVDDDPIPANERNFMDRINSLRFTEEQQERLLAALPAKDNDWEKQP